MRDSSEIIKKLLKEGWFEVARRGSHVNFKHRTKKGKVTVTHPVKDIPIGTLRKIYKQAGWS